MSGHGKRSRRFARDQKYTHSIDFATKGTVDDTIEARYRVLEEHVTIEGIRVIDKVELLSVSIVPRSDHLIDAGGSEP